MPPVETLTYISTRTYSAFWCGSVKVVEAKKPEDSLENFYINCFGKKLYSMFFESCRG